MAENDKASLTQLKIDRSAPVARKRRRWVRWAVVAVLLAGAAAVALMPRSQDVQATAVLVSYPSQQYVQLTASGYVVAQRRAAVASKATGRLLELNVREGSKVRKGDLLARLDASDVQAAMAATQAGVRQAEAAQRQAETGVRQAQVEQLNAEAEFKRAQSLQGQGFISAQSLEATQRRFDAARASLATAQAAVAQAQASVAQAQAQTRVQQVNQDFTEIRAPFDGVVLVKNANVGDIITPFSSAAGSQGAVVTMADMSTLEVEADVSESNLSKATIGQPVEITLDALPELRLRGKVGSIVPTVDRAKATVMTKIQFEKLDPRILPEMSAKVSFLSQAASEADQQKVLAVNPGSVLERDGKRLVLRIQGEAGAQTVEAVEVKTGRKLGDALEVSGALKAGDKLVLKPDARLQTGAKVSVSAK
ncbi:efflux RND transporter periplasmic adaptor subunit [Roseateles toxinivorans]|uniref:RND family efflux transporter MFP subunit n=1 Tax=Roseateles toxinivorans TaxID=270368 RepID=A0A4R6QTE9_9BURK|nr:efflux RND transporter periplasmic adaptor subunit [Roseateles toxinivorans]TDP73141.1 RND family efflux transporter MFP subunit [Roseateles toxinivorans]